MWSRTSRAAVFALAVLAGVSILLPMVATHDPLAIAIDDRLAPPGALHWFGTDELGRDLFSRVMSGIALTVSISIAATLSSLAIGVVLGATAGYCYRRWPDRLFGWCVDFLVSMPFLLVMAAVLSVAGPGLGKAYVVLTALMWVNPARIVRAEVVRTLPLDYVKAVRALGFPEWRILAFTVIPGCIDSAVLFSVSYLPEIIALEAGLSFLGLGVQPPQPGLGKTIFDGINYLDSAWWMAVLPSAALFAIILAVQFIIVIVKHTGDGPN